MNSSASPSCDFRSITKASALLDSERLHTSTVGNSKIACYERSYYCYIYMPTFRVVLFLRNLSLGGKLCLHDYKNTGSFHVKSPRVPHDPSQMFPKKLLKIPQCVLRTQNIF